MRLITQRALDRVVGAALCRILSLFPWRYREIPSGFRPQKILVILLSEMGSLVLSKPMFQLLGEKYPDASLHLLLFERNKEVLEILDLVPDKRVLTIDDRSLRGFLFSVLRLVWRLRRMNIDTVVDGELFSRVSSLLSLLCGAKVRVGFEPHTQEGLYRGGFINRPVLYNPYRHFSLQLVAMAESIGGQGRPLVKRSSKALLSIALPFRTRRSGAVSMNAWRGISLPSEKRNWCWSIPGAVCCPYAPGRSATFASW